MGRFAWTSGHHKHPSDKTHALPEWFSKSSGEPSRQALSELIKEHSPPGSTHTRSRTNTVSSKLSKEAKSSSDRSSTDASTRPPSESSIMDETQFSPDRPDRTSKHFLSKGTRMMRRQTSKLNMLASHGDDGRAAGLSRVRSAGHLLNMHTKRSDPRLQISGPFDFQHVLHTDQSQYRNLTKTANPDLADSFEALQADRHPGHQIKGILVADLPSSSFTSETSQVSPPQSPAFSIVPSLPASPPKPAPPPKDHLRLLSLGGDVRMSRSMENFSWPTRSPPLESDEYSKTESSSHLTQADPSPSDYLQTSSYRLAHEQSGASASAPASPRQFNYPPVTAELLDKPLPQPPTVVHAVSTSDDATLMMKVAPLPQVPQRNSTLVELPKSEVAPTTPKILSPIRPLQPLQPNRQLRRRSQSSSEIPFPSAFASTTAVLASPPRPVRQSRRISVGIKKIDIDDWEDAIDYSWDHAFDGDDYPVLSTESITKSDVLPQTSSAFVPHRTSSARQLNHLVPVSAQSIRTTKSDMNLLGLGIKSTRPEADPYAETEYEEYSEKHESLKVPYTRRRPGSPISKSSSQESIILSIASSIMSTHRSSNSSTSLGDMSQLESIKDEDTLPLGDSAHVASGSGSVSSSETVTTDRKSGPPAEVNEDTLEELPAVSHQRGVSASRLPFVSSSVAPATKYAARQRSSTLNSGRRLNARASYSLFPTAPSATSAT